MKENCLFCNKFEPRHPDHVDYVCSACVQMLLHTDKDQMKKLKAKAESKNNKRQLKAIRMFFR